MQLGWLPELSTSKKMFDTFALMSVNSVVLDRSLVGFNEPCKPFVWNLALNDKAWKRSKLRGMGPELKSFGPKRFLRNYSIFLKRQKWVLWPVQSGKRAKRASDKKREDLHCEKKLAKIFDVYFLQWEIFLFWLILLLHSKWRRLLMDLASD